MEADQEDDYLHLPSSKLPRGRHLIGDRVVYDINVRLQGEKQPQLLVTPITKYQSDPQLVLGRRIAVNGKYICYVLTMGSIRVLNIKTALRVLLKDYTHQRVSDIAFFAEDVHLLASATVDGRFYVWKISEGPDDEDRQQIIGSVVIAVQIVGEEGVTHPRVCWHSRKQEILIIGIGKHVLRIDTAKVGKSETYSPEGPIICSIDKLIDGIQYVGNHDGEVTDLSISQWMTTRLVSASTDGTIKIWEDRKAQPLLVLRPHNGDPVSSVLFLTAPERPDHIVLMTAGPLNRQVKFWVSTNEEGWLSSDAESWHCTQTLDLQDSGESRADEAFFNQIVPLSQAGLLICANAKKNAIYAVHIDYGSNAAATRMDYITEFTVTMPILSFTGTSGLSYYGAHNNVAVYCVQTQAIQQYALHLAQCLPPPLDQTGIENSDSIVSLETANGFEQDSTLGDNGCEQPVTEYTVDRQVCNSGTNVSDTLSAADDSRNDDKNVSRDDMTGAQNHINVCKLVTHLITSEILRADSSSDTTNITGSNPCSQTFSKLPTHLITPSELPRETEESVQPEFRHLLSLIVEPILQIKESVQSDFRHQVSLRVQPILQEVMESVLSDFRHRVSLRVQPILQEIKESVQSVIHHQVSLAVQPMLQALDGAFAQYDAELQQRLAKSSARPDSFA